MERIETKCIFFFIAKYLNLQAKFVDVSYHLSVVFLIMIMKGDSLVIS